MDLSAYTLHEDVKLVLCRGRHGKRTSPRCPDERRDGYILTSVGRRVALTTRRGIARKVS
jgi:hypothetical protein